jgi:putative ABC transport system substrate-binding protein
MDRRTALLSLLAAGAFPAAAGVSRRRTVVLFTRPGDDAAWLRDALAERGWREGSAFAMLVRAVENDRFEEDARSVVATQPDVMLARSGYRVKLLAALAPRVPIVCVGVSDAVEMGLARSLARPGGNVTGLSYDVGEVAGQVIALLKAIAPRVSRLVAIGAANRENDMATELRPVGVAASRAGVKWEFASVGRLADFDTVFPASNDPATQAAWLTTDFAAMGEREVTRYLLDRRIAAVGGGASGWTRDGALMSYVRTFRDQPGRVAAMVDKLLRGAAPASIPFEVPDLVEFAINRGTARGLGLAIPAEVQVRVTEFVP